MGRAIVRLAEDEYVEWSTVVDAPVSYVFTREYGLANGEDPTRLDRADKQGHSYFDNYYKNVEDFVSCNRAGPKESSITLDAIRRMYANPESYEAFVLSPEDIQPFTTDDGGVIYWIPWAPGQAPETITDETDLHAQVLFDSLNEQEKTDYIQQFIETNPCLFIETDYIQQFIETDGTQQLVEEGENK